MTQAAGFRLATLTEVPRRFQAALFMLLLVLSPIAGGDCGVHCVAVAAHSREHPVATRGHVCVRASACCPAAPTLCSMTPLSDSAIAPLITGTNLSQGVVASNIRGSALTLFIRVGGSSFIDVSPPGWPDRASPIPLRV